MLFRNKLFSHYNGKLLHFGDIFLLLGDIITIFEVKIFSCYKEKLSRYLKISHYNNPVIEFDWIAQAVIHALDHMVLHILQ